MDPLTISVAAFGVSALLAREAKTDKANQGPVDSRGNAIRPVESGTPYDTEADPNVSLGAVVSTVVPKGKFSFKVIGTATMAGLGAGMAAGPVGALIGTGVGITIGAILAVIVRMNDPIEFQKWAWDSWGMPHRPDLTRYEDGRVILTIPSADLFTPQELAFSQEWIRTNLCGGSEAVFKSWVRGGVFAWYPRGLETPFQALLYQCAPWLVDWEKCFLVSFNQREATVEGSQFNISWANFPDSILSEKGVGERIQIIRRAHYYQARGFGLQAWHTIGYHRDKALSKLDVLDFKGDNEDVREVYHIIHARIDKIAMADIGYPGAFFLVPPETMLSAIDTSSSKSVAAQVMGSQSLTLASNLAVRMPGTGGMVGKLSLASAEPKSATDTPIKFGLWMRTGLYSCGPVHCSTEWFADLYGSNALVAQELVQGNLAYTPLDTGKISERFRTLFSGLREGEKHPRILQRYNPSDWPTKGIAAYPTNRSGGLTRIDKSTGEVSQITSGLSTEGEKAFALQNDNVLDWVRG